SSSSVYGSNTKIPFSEGDVTDSPVSLYAATKKGGELLAKSYHHLYNIPMVGLRFFTVYGPWGRPDMAYYSFAKKIMREEPLPLYNHGKMERDFTYIDDIVDGIIATLDHPEGFEIYNLGNNRPEPLMRLVELLEKYLGKKAHLTYKPMQKGDVTSTYADITKANQAFGYAPKTSLDQGIAQFSSWFLERLSPCLESSPY
ncbi:MAG: GDP-mannose 4,6-dehydratase, partial [Chlamydiia bacterium]|nr:GDP-mannose 4,6-dehydratase [Chlamydiia bacterium]